MGRRLYTEEEKQIAKMKAYERNKQYQIDNKERFDTYMKSYYQLNKERLNTRNCAMKKEKKELLKQQKNAENA